MCAFTNEAEGKINRWYFTDECVRYYLSARIFFRVNLETPQVHTVHLVVDVLLKNRARVLIIINAVHFYREWQGKLVITNRQHYRSCF